MTDRELVDKFLLTRSEESFRSLYRACSSVFPVVLRVMKNDREQAEEIIQDMWMIAIRKLPEFEWRSSLSTWLISIAINLARKRNITRSESNDLDEDVRGADISIGIDLEQAIAALPQGYREVVILHDVEGYKHHEIAGMLGISEGTSKSQLFHARRKLRTFLT